MWDSLLVLPWVNTSSVLLVLTPDVKRERIAKTNKFMTNILFSLDETEHKTEKIGRNTEDRICFQSSTPCCFKDSATISEIHSNQFLDILVLNIPILIRPHWDTSQLPTLGQRKTRTFSEHFSHESIPKIIPFKSNVSVNWKWNFYVSMSQLKQCQCLSMSVLRSWRQFSVDVGIFSIDTRMAWVSGPGSEQSEHSALSSRFPKR